MICNCFRMRTPFLACMCGDRGTSEVRELATANINYITSVEIILYVIRQYNIIFLIRIKLCN